jgi:hypothetical protein
LLFVVVVCFLLDTFSEERRKREEKIYDVMNINIRCCLHRRKKMGRYEDKRINMKKSFELNSLTKKSASRSSPALDFTYLHSQIRIVRGERVGNGDGITREINFTVFTESS